MRLITHTPAQFSYTPEVSERHSFSLQDSVRSCILKVHQGNTYETESIKESYDLQLGVLKEILKTFMRW